jgi:hypothetical protein
MDKLRNNIDQLNSSIEIYKIEKQKCNNNANNFEFDYNNLLIK